MSSESLIVPKVLKPVHLWVHPEGRVLGSLYLHCPGQGAPSDELPIELLNEPAPFLVCRCGPQGHPQTRFYSKNALIRIDYEDETEEAGAARVQIGAEFQMMDGAVFRGQIREDLPPDRQRLLDYMNVHTDRFVRVFLEGGGVTLINKAYIMRVVPLED